MSGRDSTTCWKASIESFTFSRLESPIPSRFHASKIHGILLHCRSQRFQGFLRLSRGKISRAKFEPSLPHPLEERAKPPRRRSPFAQPAPSSLSSDEPPSELRAYRVSSPPSSIHLARRRAPPHKAPQTPSIKLRETLIIPANVSTPASRSKDRTHFPQLFDHTPSLHHSITPSLHHSITPSLHHSISPPLRSHSPITKSRLPQDGHQVTVHMSRKQLGKDAQIHKGRGPDLQAMRDSTSLAIDYKNPVPPLGSPPQSRSHPRAHPALLSTR